MNITCYSNFSKKVNSTKQPTGGTVKTVTLKQPTSIINPVFVMNGYDLTCNYIKWGSRYYYVDDIVLAHNDVAEYHCKVDPLASFKTEIGSSSQFVVRSASAYNLFLNDAIYPTRTDSVRSTTLLPALTCYEDSNVSLNTGGCYIMGIQNSKGGVNGGITYYAMSGIAMNNLLDYLFDKCDFLDASDISQELQKELINPFQYINSLQWFPFDITGSSAITDTEILKFGYWTAPDGTGGTTAVYGYPLKYKSLSFGCTSALPAHPDAATRGYYLGSAPYTRRTLLFNSFGSIPLDPVPYSVVGTIALVCHIDLVTGAAILNVTDSNGDIVYKGSGQVGVPSQISQVTQNMVGAGMSVLGGAVGLAYGNAVGFAQGIVSGLENLMPQRQTTGAIGSSADWEHQAVPMIVSEFYRQSPADSTDLGRPLCERRTINTLTGYVQVQNADLETSATSGEKSEILSYMERGFFYE